MTLNYCETTSLNDDISKLLVWMRFFWNYFFQLLVWITAFGNYLIKSQCLDTTCLNDGTSKLLVWMTVFGNYVFERWYLDTTCLSDGIWKLLLWMTVSGNSFFERRCLEIKGFNDCPQSYFIQWKYLKLLVWITVFRVYLFQWQYF